VEQTKKRRSFSRWTPIEMMMTLLFLVAPFYYQPNWGGEGLLIPNNVLVWFVGFMIGSYAVYQFSHNGILRLPKYVSYIVAFPVLVVVAGFVTGVDEPTAWFFRLSFIWFGLLFFISLFQYELRQGRVDRLLFIVILSAMFQAVIGILQARFPDIVASFYPTSTRPYGIFQQINNQASYQVTAIVVAIFLLTRPYINKGSLWRKVIVLLFLATSAFVVTYSGSRIGILSAIISIPIMILWRRVYLKRNKILSLLAALFFISGALSGSSGLMTVVDKTAALNSGLSANARLGIYTVALELIEQKPLFGHGLGSFTSVFHYEKGKFHNSHPDVKLIDLYVTHPHNEILFWLIEGGIIATVGIAFLVAGIYFSIKSEKKYRRYGYVAMLLPIALHTQVELPFYTSAIHWFSALFLLFVVMRINSFRMLVPLSVSMMWLLRIISLILLIWGTLFFAHTFRSMYQISNIDMGAELWDLSIAENNPYFSDFVENMRMKTVLLKIYQNGTTDQMESLIDWANMQLKREPTSRMFIFVAMAYQKMGNKAEMCRTIDTGISIYPQNSDLQNAITFCQK